MDQQNDIDTAMMQADVERMTKAGDAELAQADGVRMAQDQFTDNMAFFHQLVGRSQALSAVREITNVLDFSQLAQFKDNKGYRAWKGQKTPNGLVFSGKWKEFCTEFLGKSDVTIDAGIANVKEFGPEAVEGMQRLGISARKFAELRRLPEDDKGVMAEAAKTADKDDFLDLTEALILKHAKEKEAATQREATLTETLNASNKVSEDKNKHIHELAVENERLKGSLEGPGDSPTVLNIRDHGGTAAAKLILLRGMANRLAQEGSKADPNEVAALTGVLDAVRTELALAYRLLEAADPAYQACNELAGQEAWNPDAADAVN